MTILGSREQTCIHPQVSKMKNKNEGCSELLNASEFYFFYDSLFIHIFTEFKKGII